MVDMTLDINQSNQLGNETHDDDDDDDIHI